MRRSGPPNRSSTAHQVRDRVVWWCACHQIREDRITHDPIPVEGLVFPTDRAEPVAVQRIDGSAEGVEALVDGQTEAVMLGEAGPVMFVDAYGPGKGLPANPRATRFADGYLPGYANANMVRGVAVVIGLDPETSARADVSAADVEAALRV